MNLADPIAHQPQQVPQAQCRVLPQAQGHRVDSVVAAKPKGRIRQVSHRPSHNHGSHGCRARGRACQVGKRRSNSAVTDARFASASKPARSSTRSDATRASHQVVRAQEPGSARKLQAPVRRSQVLHEALRHSGGLCQTTLSTLSYGRLLIWAPQHDSCMRAQKQGVNESGRQSAAPPGCSSAAGRARRQRRSCAPRRCTPRQTGTASTPGLGSVTDLAAASAVPYSTLCQA